mmetsp:Transcript_50715/g.120561  ORF Transcript_50715/g.120561 Transcript_50715/m.120561 type:complete len:315 (+) Transcript_50715:920-1864(+)
MLLPDWSRANCLVPGEVEEGGHKPLTSCDVHQLLALSTQGRDLQHTPQSTISNDLRLIWRCRHRQVPHNANTTRPRICIHLGNSVGGDESHQGAFWLQAWKLGQKLLAPLATRGDVHDKIEARNRQAALCIMLLFEIAVLIYRAVEHIRLRQKAQSFGGKSLSARRVHNLLLLLHLAHSLNIQHHIQELVLLVFVSETPYQVDENWHACSKAFSEPGGIRWVRDEAESSCDRPLHYCAARVLQQGRHMVHECTSERLVVFGVHGEVPNHANERGLAVVIVVSLCGVFFASSFLEVADQIPEEEPIVLRQLKPIT